MAAFLFGINQVGILLTYPLQVLQLPGETLDLGIDLAQMEGVRC